MFCTQTVFAVAPAISTIPGKGFFLPLLSAQLSCLNYLCLILNTAAFECECQKNNKNKNSLFYFDEICKEKPKVQWQVQLPHSIPSTHPCMHEVATMLNKQWQVVK